MAGKRINLFKKAKKKKSGKKGGGHSTNMHPMPWWQVDPRWGPSRTR